MLPGLYCFLDVGGANQTDRVKAPGMEKNSEPHWRFGTAGFRAKMGDAPGFLNADSITQIAYAVGRFLKPSSLVVIGYDARHHSQEFALLAAQVLDALGHSSLLFSRLIPTPICAFAVTQLKAHAGIMITASHNPATDNGVKVYGPDGAQLIAPDTQAIEAILDQAPQAKQIALSKERIQELPEKTIHAYFETIQLKSSPSSFSKGGIKIIYTPLHGVGTEYALKALNNAGFENILVVPEQAKPDGAFPTVQFPNPEEPGALDLAINLSKQTQADLILANDPDADRLAVCIGTQVLTGNEIGILLANYLIEQTKLQKPLVMTTLVSSRMLSKIASKNKISYAETLTGFANIAHLALEREKKFGEEFLFGYEEALGYCIGKHVRDKDGISAAVLFAQLFADLKSQGKTVFDELDRLFQIYGLHRTLQWSIRTESKMIPDNWSGLRKQKSTAPGLVVYTGEHDLRLIIRPSGTEPKIKFYAEVIGQIKDKISLDLFLSDLKRRMNV